LLCCRELPVLYLRIMSSQTTSIPGDIRGRPLVKKAKE
jgi:hypothetical protein